MKALLLWWRSTRCSLALSFEVRVFIHAVNPGSQVQRAQHRHARPAIGCVSMCEVGGRGSFATVAFPLAEGRKRWPGLTVPSLLLVLLVLGEILLPVQRGHQHTVWLPWPTKEKEMTRMGRGMVLYEGEGETLLPLVRNAGKTWV